MTSTRPSSLAPRHWAMLMLLALCVVDAAALESANENLGVLFYSPAERSAITRGRAEGQAEELPPSSIQLGGVVRRGQGKSTAWINNHPLAEGHRLGPVQGRAGGQADAPIITPTGIAVDGKHLRIGESLDLTTGERSDFVPPGTLSVKKPQ